jgi:hypothetical protein
VSNNRTPMQPVISQLASYWPPWHSSC